jgi:23S rRNA (adenine2503-C2)-methyltransferase
MIRTSLCGSTPDEILNSAAFAGISLPQVITILNSIYRKKIKDLSELPDISKKHKEELGKTFVAGFYDPESSRKSIDGTVKYLFRNEAGLLFETVYMADKKRNTVCVSTQSGCRMGCPFCATGKYGFHGNLDTRDIINQVLSLPKAGKVNRVVFMGMGEPMDNLENVLKACSIMTAEWGLSLGCSNITVSTVGITPRVREYLEKSDCNLALSLFSPFPGERIRVVPAEKKYPAIEIIELMKEYAGIKRRRMTVAYIMIKGRNDKEVHLQELRKLFAGSGIRINLLPYHSIPGDSNISSGQETMQYFKHELIMAGISASIRKSRGIDVSAACGLLASF